MTQRFISYAQHGEDVILWRALRERGTCSYVDVGAYDPTFDSVTRALYERGWRGINIEAQPSRLEFFERDRPEDLNLALAIGDVDGTAMLQVPAVEGWATIRPGLAAPVVSQVEVPVRRLSTVLAEHGVEHVDVLKIDVEGMEPEAVAGLLDGPVRPLVCVVEGVAPEVGQEAGLRAVDLLVRAGYTHCMFDGLNHYLTVEPGLVAPLSVPANPLDDYIPAALDNLIVERGQLHEAVARLATENLSLRDAVAVLTESSTGRPVEPAVSEDHAPEGGAADAPPAAEPDSGAPRTDEAEPSDAAFDGGDLPMPTDDAAGEALLVPTAAAPAPSTGPLGLPVRPPTVVPAAERAARRRASFARALSGPAPVLPPASARDAISRLDPQVLAAAAPGDAVEMLYQVVLGRASDTEGLNAWTAHIEAGVPLLAVAQALVASAEARARPAGARRRVAADLVAWASSEALDDLGVVLTSAARTFRPGAVAHEIFVAALYEVALQRRPTREEERHEVAKLMSGVGREWLLRAFAARPEARERFLGAARPGLRATLRGVRDRRQYLATFREHVAAAESRQVTQLLMGLSSGDANVGGAAPAAGSREEH